MGNRVSSFCLVSWTATSKSTARAHRASSASVELDWENRPQALGRSTLSRRRARAIVEGPASGEMDGTRTDGGHAGYSPAEFPK